MPVFGFPNPVNEKAARSVAALVVVLALATVISQSIILLALLTLGFAARVLSGPTLSPFGQVATRVIAPRLGPPRLVAGPPKRFAQSIGLVLSGAALISALLGATLAPWLLVGAVVVAATLEAAFGLCLGCRIFAVLQRIGWIPESVCLACSDLSLRGATAS